MGKWIYDKYFAGFGTCLEVNSLLFSQISPYQKIEIFDTEKWGRLLVLDGAVQLSERDEFIYHEIISHIPLFSYGNAQRVLIIGDGDGGILREVLKHPIDDVYLVEIDKDVVDTCQKYLPSISQKSFENKKVKLVIGDGAKFVKDFNNLFDVVIVGAPDPIGPGLTLFSQEFYKNVFHTLTPAGIMIIQSGPILAWPNTDYGKITARLKTIFPHVATCSCIIPTYPGSVWTFAIGSKKIDVRSPNTFKLADIYKRSKIVTKYYNPRIHLESFKLLKYVPKILFYNNIH